ncbi:branched-chain amino acid ABC transporter ATP-binding protein/permease [Actinomadura citrea]|jgi:branched-chain amino acid transport system permease protein|uniref:Branched-chain amino acid transport system permease protein n=1 Tax=Actinomadura citrea TaxID=46158 RepID=A0A7Y9KEL9_9ACTN|nr:branched-chain amino acid ABC transporter ATP-binding protein/permease [Actinomadura citrea]NYE14635.1 branched-chain amino acid transport system permease protein [Actinomadura citrea]GGT83952.1 metal-dependent hydrolase [Actinomadura citrea]
MNALLRHRRTPGLATLVALVLVAWLLPYQLGGYAIHVVNIALVFALLAIGMGLAMGIAGQINLAQVAFFGVSAYATAILTTDKGLGFWPAALIALVATALIGLLVGIPALRMQSHYLGIVTLGLALGFINWTTNAELAGGAEGISAIPVPPMFGVDLSSEYLYYYLEVVVFAGALAFGLFVVRTGLGRRMMAMRDDPLAAGAVGAEIPLLRMTAFMLSSVFGGLAGILYAGLIRYVAPDTFNIANMFLLLAMVVIGGRQSLVGCVVGAVGLTLVREQLVDYPTYAQLGFGAVVVLMVVFAPTGLAGVPARVRTLVHRRRGRTAERAVLRPFRPYEPVDAADAAGGTGPGGEPLLEIREIAKHFRGLKALKDVSLTVRRGEIRGIVGPNGSGKTTLFNVISGFYRPSGGRVLMDGRVVSGSRPYRLSMLGVARTFQNLRLFGELSVRDNLLVALDRSRTRAIWRYALWPVGVWRQERRLHRRADELLDRFGLTGFAGAAPGSLPYGIQRRIEIARAMAAGPRLLLLDEPAAGLNGEEVRQLAEIVRSIRDSGVTVVLIEHNMGLVMSLCERVTVLGGGSVIAEGTPAEVVADHAVIEAYLGDSAMAGMPLPDTSEVTS